jgi:methylisocitrate lyase
MTDHVKEAVDARTDDQFVLMARTEALAVEGLEAAIERACVCVESGAGMIFPEAMTDLKMYKQFVDAVKAPVKARQQPVLDSPSRAEPSRAEPIGPPSLARNRRPVASESHRYEYRRSLRLVM